MNRPIFAKAKPLAALLGVLHFAFAGWADDWPRWRGADGSGRVAEGVRVPATLPAEARFAWKKPIGHGHGSPVVSGGRVYYLDHQNERETVHAVDAGSGRTRWSVPLDELHQDNHSKPGPRSTPVVDGDRIYVQSCRGEFRCLNAVDGRTIWRKNFVADFKAVFAGETGKAPGASRHGNSGSAWIEGGRILVAVGGREGASMVCFDKRDGKVVWSSQNDIPGYGGPVVATVAGLRQVLTFTAEAVIGLRFDTGALLWRVPVKTSVGRHVASPIAFDDLVIAGSHQAGLMGLRIAREGDGGKAETAWLEKRIAINFSSPVLHGGCLYGLGPGGMMFCADPRTGVQRWAHELTGSGPDSYAAFIGLGENILALTDAGELLLVAADPREFRLIGRLKVAGENWCHPAYAGGRLYLRDKDELICLELMR